MLNIMKCSNCSNDMIQSKAGWLCVECGHIEMLTDDDKNKVAAAIPAPPEVLGDPAPTPAVDSAPQPEAEPQPESESEPETTPESVPSQPVDVPAETPTAEVTPEVVVRYTCRSAYSRPRAGFRDREAIRA